MSPAEPTIDLDRVFQKTEVHRLLGMRIERTERGVALRGTVPRTFARLEGMDTLHGGTVATLLDSATTYAAVAATDRSWATTDLRIDYLRPSALGEIEVVAFVVHAGSTVCRAGAELRDASERLTATAVATLVAEHRTGS